jgi:YHS domain-containing protein
VDHSKMDMGTAAKPAPVKGAKPAPPVAPMDHSKMSMPTASDASAQASDPVCGLKVNPATAPSTKHQGQTYYFCSEQHQQLFQKNPAKFLPKQQ